ncbi:MAG TPA: hypothetical protein VMT51_07810 [Dongiaceae bacterium]|nr:hypothetical protein [Dongiaceae bacterium]
MRRVFSHPLTALVSGLLLRLAFVFKLPSTGGDTGLYETLASNWVTHRVYGIPVNDVLTPVDLRMPGYPAYLALVQLLTRRSGEDARLFVMLGQVLVDLAACLVIANLASRLAARAEAAPRAFTAALWLAVLCPFTANYTAVPLTESFAVLFTALALYAFVNMVKPGDQVVGSFRWARFARPAEYLRSALFAGLCLGLGTLFRPETPLLLIAAAPVILIVAFRRGQLARGVRGVAFCGVALAVVLIPWTVRNALTLREFQPLTSKYTTMPGEVVPIGFMKWEATWLYRFREVFLVPWKLNDEAIDIETIPGRAFDSPEERQHVAAILEQYNRDLSLTAEEDAEFGAIAKARTERHPLRTYVSVPLQRVVTLWFTPRIEQIPISGDVFPLAHTWDTDRPDMLITIGLFFLNVFYLALALAGALRLWFTAGTARAAIVLFVFFVVLRTAFLTTVETPEPRYVLVCFPAVMALAAQVFARKSPV